MKSRFSAEIALGAMRTKGARAAKALGAAIRRLAVAWRRPIPPAAPLWPLGAALTVFAGAALICLAIGLDGPTARAVAALGPKKRAYDLITLFGLSNWLFALTLIYAGWSLWRRETAERWREKIYFELQLSRAFYFFVVLAVSGLAAQAFKHVFGRARPYLAEQLGAFHFDPFSAKAVLASFPSGHTTSVFAVFLALTLVWPRIGPAFLLIAIPVAVSRVMVGAHYPTDVLAGMALGLVSALWLARAFARRKIAFELAPGAVWPRPRRLRLPR